MSAEKYKLLRDLPGYKAGTIFVQDPYWTYLSADGQTKTSCTDLAGTLNCACYESDWFEPLPEAPTRWRPQGDDKFYFVTYKFGVAEAFSHYSHEQDDLNIFHTKEQAQAVADAIKSLLEYVHLPNDGLNPYNGLNTLFETSKKARKAVQANNQ